MVEPPPSSEFNSAILVMNRINYWFYLAEESQSHNDYVEWYKSLMNCYLNLKSLMREDDIKEAWSLFLNLNTVLNNHKDKQNMSFTNFEKFIELHLLLDDAFTYSGLKTKMKNDPRFSRR